MSDPRFRYVAELVKPNGVTHFLHFAADNMELAKAHLEHLVSDPGMPDFYRSRIVDVGRE